jgi:cytochrome P450/deferrochelatase/peroxidase EfeB
MSSEAGAPARPPAAPAAEQRPVTSGLNLWLALERPEDMPKLLGLLQRSRQRIDDALVNLHYVHFARFLPAPGGAALQVITEFDGEFDAYVLDFVLAIGDEFDKILQFVRNRPAFSVKDDPARFLAFVRANNLGYSADQPGNIRLFSAYPNRTVLDIVGTGGKARLPDDATPVKVDRADVQANVLRGVDPALAHHMGLRFTDVPAAHRLLEALLPGGEGPLQISSDDPWRDKNSPPPYWLCVGFTFRGLLALGISDTDRAEFELAHKAFVRGPDHRDAARANGDVGDSQPAFWELGGGHPVDMVLSLYADDRKELAERRDQLRALCSEHRMEHVTEDRDWASAEVLRDDQGRHRVHFGYVDGLAQPRLAIDDAPPLPAADDMQPLAGVGEFLLGEKYPNVFGGRSSLGGLSAALARNGTFAALRVMEQHVAAFERLLDQAAKDNEVKRDWVAAKLMGRWFDGTPVSLSPDEPPKPGATVDNAFDYLPSNRNPHTHDDSAGLRCPVGAHARRMNPRSARVAGRPNSRRMLRRGMPYGARFDPDHPDGKRRGLIGLFLCADLDRQFEFVLRQWAQGDLATSGLKDQQDPFIGAQQALPGGPLQPGLFRIPRPSPLPEIEIQLPRLVKTVGSAYLFMPGLGGLRHLAERRPKKPDGPIIQRRTPPQRDVPRRDPKSFDPRDHAFRNDPFTAYESFRQHCPVVTLPTMNSTWVFTDQHVAEVTAAPEQFRKRHSGDTSPTGLLNMDEPWHGRSRATYGGLFHEVLKDVGAGFEQIVARTYQERCRGQGESAPIDWVTSFAAPVAQEVFRTVFGLDAARVRNLVAQVEDILALATPADDKAVQADLARRQQALVSTLFSLQGEATTGRLFARFLGVTEVFDPVNNKARPSATALQLEQLVNGATMAMTGILPLQWFIALACWRLLEEDGQRLRQIKDDKTITTRMVVNELLRYDMSPPMTSRHVVRDNTELGDLVLNRDQRVNLVFASANRDEAKYGPDAHLIDFRRQKAGPGWAFGYGDRECLGKDLVYAVMEPVIDTLRTATPAPRLAKDFVPHWGTWSEGALFRAMTALMVHS